MNLASDPFGGTVTDDSGTTTGDDTPLTTVMDEVAGAQGVDRAAVAVAWLLAHPAKIMPVMGTNNISRIKGFSDALKVEMDRPTWFKLYEAALGHEVP